MPLMNVDLFAELDQHNDRIPLDTIQLWLENAVLNYEVVRPYLRFHPDHYVRNLMYSGPAYQALVLCWHNGQRSPIHDHQGSNCGVKILQGTALETLFEFAPNEMIYPVATRELVEGEITFSHDDDIHQMSNLQPSDGDLVTLHIYSPPLFYMNTYSLVDASVSRFFDPVNDEFVGGAGI